MLFFVKSECRVRGFCRSRSLEGRCLRKVCICGGLVLAEGMYLWRAGACGESAFAEDSVSYTHRMLPTYRDV